MRVRTIYTLIYDRQYKQYAVQFRTVKGAKDWMTQRIESGEITGILIHQNIVDQVIWRNPDLDLLWTNNVLDKWKGRLEELHPKKKLTKILSNCQRCPYSRYHKISDPQQIKFGYVCTAENKVILEIQPKENESLKKVIIPDWCPLGDYVSPERSYELK